MKIKDPEGPPVGRKRLPIKVRAFRRKQAKKYEGIQDMVAEFVHKAHAGKLPPETSPEATAPPFPRIPGLTDVSLSLDSQFMRDDKVTTRWTVTATHSGPVGGFPSPNP